MGEQENIKIVQQAYQNFKTGNIPALLNMVSERVEWRLPEIDNVPFAGRRRGRDQVAQFFSLVAEAQEVQQFEPQEFIAQGDKVVVLGHYAWRVKKTGRTFKSDWAHVFTVRDGAVVGFHEYTDTAASAAAYK